MTSLVGTKEYLYDYSGNMVKDLNKGVAEIVYNYLNLPEQVTMDNGDTIHYAYDASGVKHYKIVDDGTPDTTQYVGLYHFINSDLKFIQHAEGRAVKNGSNYDYEYNLSDHLGNVRVTVDESGAVVQRQDYYAFGGTFNEWTSGTENLYKYNTFEEQKETGWYDYQARFYDPTLGRFLNVDPAADLMRRHSTYAYAFNNPIRFTDPDGMKPSDQSDQYTDNHSASTFNNDHDPEGDEGGDKKGDPKTIKRSDYPEGEAGDREFRRAIGRARLAAFRNGAAAVGTSVNGETNSIYFKQTDGDDSRFRNTLASLPLAATLSVADGPIPLGEIAGLAFIATALYQDITNPFGNSKDWTTDTPEAYIPRGPEGFDPKKPKFPDRITRWAFAGYLVYKLRKSLNNTVPEGSNSQEYSPPADNIKYFVPKRIIKTN